ncbi:hypothetical protein CsSME_00036626 [Camellia sinensis var. sinensis]
METVVGSPLDVKADDEVVEKETMDGCDFRDLGVNEEGRTSDKGVDLIALALQLPLLNPYLEKNASFDHGANFAVAGSTVLDSSFLAARGIQIPIINTHLSMQLNWFRTLLNSTCPLLEECVRRLTRAIVYVGEIGGNDFNYAFSQGKSIQEIQTHVPDVVGVIINGVREVIRLGAMQVVVLGNFPIVCLSIFLTTLPSADPGAYDNLGCLHEERIISRFGSTVVEHFWYYHCPLADDGWILVAGTSNWRVVFYDVRGKPQPLVELHAYGNSEVNFLSSISETALLGGAVEDSLLMPDPLPSVTSSSLSTSITTAGSRNPGRSGPSIESSSMLATSSGFMLSSLHSSTTEETPLFGTLWTGGNLTRLHAPHNYNFKDDMKVFSPLVEVQPITPSLDKLWDQHEGAKKDHLRVDKKPSLLFPSSNRRFPLSEEGGGSDHPIFDWKPSSTSKQVYFLPLSNSLSILLNHLFAA